MTHSRCFTLAVAPLLLPLFAFGAFAAFAALGAACGGETVGSGASDGESHSSSGPTGSGATAGGTLGHGSVAPGGSGPGSTALGSEGTVTTVTVTGSDGSTTVTLVTGSVATSSTVGSSGSACVDLDLTASDTACRTGADCTLASSGRVCSGQCNCGSTPMNNAAASQFEAALDGLALDDCPCASPGVAVCDRGQCQLCSGGPNDPPDCAATSGSPPDAGSSDAGECVDIDLSTYKTSCQQASDCAVIAAGELCSGGCDCPDSPVSASELSRWQEAISGLSFEPCGCPAEIAPSCIGGQCIECYGGPDQPAGCPSVDGGF